MNILILSQYFWPEQFLINDLVLRLKELGHSITIYTGKPNYPDGNIYSGYSSSGVHEEYYAGDIPVYRVPLRPRKSGGKNLALNYLSFIYSGLKHSFRFAKNKKIDVIFVFGLSPITSVIPAILIKWLTKSHLVTWVQDLWPESIEASGFIRNKFLLSCLRLLVKGIYFFTDTLLVQSKGFIPPVSRLARKNKIIYYPNSAMDTYEAPTKKNKIIPNELNNLLDTQFCVIFAGNIGVAQSVETIVIAAENLKELSDFKIIFIGSGSKSDWLKKQIKNKKLNNIVLAGRYNVSDMPCLYSKASGLIVTLKKDDIFSYTIPSKVQSYLAAGKPIIAALNGEGANVIQDSGAGLVSPAEDAEKLAKNLKKLYHMPFLLRDEMGQSGRAYFLNNFEMSKQSKRLIQILEQITKQNGV